MQIQRHVGVLPPERDTDGRKPLAQGQWLGAYCLTEPNAGSNAANQQTTAVLDGDHFVLNGEKVWTSYGELSDWMFCIVRTDPKAKKPNSLKFGPEGARMLDFDVLVEIPKGNRNKYEVDHKTGRIRLDRTLFTSTQYPADYGFIENTLGVRITDFMDDV